MSTNHGLFCWDCAQVGYYGGCFDTRWETIVQILEARAQLEKVIDLIRELEVIPVDSLEVKISLDYGNSHPLELFEFLKDHNGHRLSIVNEYGDILDSHGNKIGETTPWN